MARKQLEVTFRGRLFHRGMPARVVGAITGEMLQLSKDMTDRAEKKFTPGHGLLSSDLKDSIRKAEIVKDLVTISQNAGQKTVGNKRIEDYMYRVEYGSSGPRAQKPQRQFKNAARWGRTQIKKKDRIGKAIAKELNG